MIKRRLSDAGTRLSIPSSPGLLLHRDELLVCPRVHPQHTRSSPLCPSLLFVSLSLSSLSLVVPRSRGKVKSDQVEEWDDDDNDDVRRLRRFFECPSLRSKGGEQRGSRRDENAALLHNQDNNDGSNGRREREEGKRKSQRIGANPGRNERRSKGNDRKTRSPERSSQKNERKGLSSNSSSSLHPADLVSHGNQMGKVDDDLTSSERVIRILKRMWFF